jgi:catechol 2,3-dioxygenase-like lactoylglutathione lyase family enzyme
VGPSCRSTLIYQSRVAQAGNLPLASRARIPLTGAGDKNQFADEHMTSMKLTLTLLALIGLLATPAKAAPEEFSSTTIGIGVVVRDLAKSLDFYTNVIGMVQTGSFTIGADFSKKSGLANGVPTDVKVLRLGKGEDATQWKLMSFGDQPKPQQGEFISGQTGMRYITILVKDLTPIVQRIKERKIKLLGETPVPLGGETRFVLVQDPDGTFIELIGPMK